MRDDKPAVRFVTSLVPRVSIFQKISQNISKNICETFLSNILREFRMGAGNASDSDWGKLLQRKVRSPSTRHHSLGVDAACMCSLLLCRRACVLADVAKVKVCVLLADVGGAKR